MNSTRPFVYIVDCPLEEQPVCGWSFYCRPILIFVPPGPLPFPRIQEFETHSFLRVHRAEGAPEEEVRRLLRDWERWARDHEAMDWNALKALDEVRSVESQNLPSLMKEIRRFGSDTTSGAGQRVENRTLLLHLARRLWKTERECSDILHEVRSKEDALKDIIDASDSEQLFSTNLDFEATVDFDAVLKRQLRAWGHFYGPVRPPAAHYVTDNQFLSRHLSAHLESVEVVRFRLPLFEGYGPAQLEDAFEEIEKPLLGQLHSCFDELARLASFAELNAGDLDILSVRFTEASQSIISAAGEGGFPLNTDKDLSVRVMLVQNRGLDQWLFGKLEGNEGAESRIEADGWAAVFTVET
ncbi:MAG: hypothetical protein HY788_21040 [Deltaproteobacteria bacterium]|nr:hypothetical protein [Deltaproteobacteria bacterium]